MDVGMSALHGNMFESLMATGSIVLALDYELCQSIVEEHMLHTGNIRLKSGMYLVSSTITALQVGTAIGHTCFAFGEALRICSLREATFSKVCWFNLLWWVESCTKWSVQSVPVPSQRCVELPPSWKPSDSLTGFPSSYMAMQTCISISNADILQGQ